MDDSLGGCLEGPAFTSLADRVRLAAVDEGIELAFRDQCWIATDVETGEQASDLSMAGAWAHLRDVDVHEVHRRLATRGATIVRPPEFVHET